MSWLSDVLLTAKANVQFVNELDVYQIIFIDTLAKGKNEFRF